MEPPLPAAAASTASSSDGGQVTPSWSSFTNWTVRRGSLQDTICFESSASILEDDGGGVDDDGAVSISRGLVLTRPAGQGAAPCELTICFRERHEIHRIYVRSSARVYEIYYASEWHNRDNEYLCTVRCGATGKEVFLPRCDSGEAVVDPLKDSNPSGEVPGKMTKSESSTSSEEDGWVEVKIPDPPLLGDGSNTFSKKQDGAIGANSQIYYEATAEISDASPCTSLILRLLSLQTRECIHVEEVYIYADPVESTDSGSPPSMTGSMTGNSLLAMLVPSMLQLSKAGNSKIQDSAVSSHPAVQKHGLDASIITEERNPKIARAGVQKTCSSVEEKEEQVSVPTVLNEIITTFDSEKDIPGPHHVPESVPEKGSATHGHLEKKMDELVLQVGRIEAFLSRFEENMLKPLSCIDTRLQRVEQQLDALSLRSVSSKPFQCSRISAPEFQFDDCDSDGSFDISDVAKEDATVDSPDVFKEDATVNSPDMVEEDDTVYCQNMAGDMPAGSAVSLAADGVAFVHASDECPGLFIKAPEFMNEEDEHVSSNDISESATIPCPKDKASLSIDDALTSAFKSFMLSTCTNSPKIGIASIPESQSSSVAVDNPKLDEHVMTCEAAEIYGTIINETNPVCCVKMDPRPDTTFKEGEEQRMRHQEWPQDSFGGLGVEEVSSNSQRYVGRDDALEMDENEEGSRKGTDNDSKNWNEESSSDSNIDESVIESHHNMDWLVENSTDSENVSFTLRNWLYGRQDDHRFKEASFMGAMNCDDTNSEVSGKSVRCNQDKSKVEIQKALNSSQDDELRDIQQVLDCPRNDESSLVDVQFVRHERRDIQQVLESPMNDVSSLLDVQFVQHEKSNYALHLDALMMNMADYETKGNNWLNDIGARKQCNSFLLGIAQLGDPVTVDDLLIDLEEGTVKNSDFSLEGSTNQQQFSSLI